jgi:hypothetical protein
LDIAVLGKICEEKEGVCVQEKARQKRGKVSRPFFGG